MFRFADNIALKTNREKFVEILEEMKRSFIEFDLNIN